MDFTYIQQSNVAILAILMFFLSLAWKNPCKIISKKRIHLLKLWCQYGIGG